MTIIDRLHNRSLESFRPTQASLELTNRCNERCTHCYIPDYTDDANRLLSFSQWKEVLGQLREAGVLYLILMGGEAMLSPNFWSVAEEGQRLGFSLAMITNGLLIDENAGRRLADTGFADITLSLYSTKPEIHDRMTKVYGSCARTMKAIEICQANNIRVGVNCLLTEANIEDYFNLEKWCGDRNLILKFDPIVTAKFGGDLTPTKKRSREDQLRAFYKEYVRRWPLGTPQPSDDQSDDHVCNAGKGKCAVTAYGDLLTCIDIREPLGNLKDQKFSDIWQSHVANKWRSIKNSEIEFTDNESKSFCEFCPGMAFNESGNAYKATEYMTLLARIKSETNYYVRSTYEQRRQRETKKSEKEVPSPQTSL